MCEPLSPSVFLSAVQSCLCGAHRRERPSLVVGVSGGLDSTVLLHLCAELYRQKKLSALRALHIHHGLHPEADHWMQHIGALCKEWRVPLSIHKVHCKSDSNQEACAREARYKVFAQELLPHEYLAQGHHGDDQAETLLYRMMRGSGIRGMGGIPATRPLGAGHIIRPLLGFRRATLTGWARRHQLEWIEDGSNNDLTFDRNFLRKEIVPRLLARWPAAVNNINRLGQLCTEADGLLQNLTAMDYEHCVQTHAVPGLGPAPLLEISSLLSLSPPRRHLLLKEWLLRTELPPPTQARLLTIIKEVAESRADSQAITAWHQAEVRRYKNFLLATPPLPAAAPIESAFSLDGRDGKDGQQALPNNGILRWHRTAAQSHTSLLHEQARCVLSLRGHKPFEPFALPGRKGRKTLKKWLNTFGVPHWLRQRLPVLHRGTRLIAIPGILVADGFQSAPGEPGWHLSWSPLPEQGADSVVANDSKTLQQSPGVESAPGF